MKVFKQNLQIKSNESFKNNNIWELQKIWKIVFILKKVWLRKENQVYWRAYSIYIKFNKYWFKHNFSKIREKIFEKFEDIRISVGTIYNILKDCNFQLIAHSIILKNDQGQHKLRIN